MRYPLEAARTVRAAAREVADRRLAEARDAHDRAKLASAAARERLEEMRAKEVARRGRAPEPSTAVALLREQTYRDARRGEDRALVAALDAARCAEKAASEAMEVARGGLGEAVVEEKVLDRHQARWARNAAKNKEKSVEDELEDQNLSRIRGSLENRRGG